jgi:hypothetical protein
MGQLTQPVIKVTIKYENEGTGKNTETTDNIPINEQNNMIKLNDDITLTITGKYISVNSPYILKYRYESKNVHNAMAIQIWKPNYNLPDKKDLFIRVNENEIFYITTEVIEGQTGGQRAKMTTWQRCKQRCLQHSK